MQEAFEQFMIHIYEKKMHRDLLDFIWNDANLPWWVDIEDVMEYVSINYSEILAKDFKVVVDEFDHVMSCETASNSPEFSDDADLNIDECSDCVEVEHEDESQEICS